MKHIDNWLWAGVFICALGAYGIYDDSHLQGDALALWACILSVPALMIGWRRAGREG